MNLLELSIDNMCQDDITQVSQIEADAYGKHHWSKNAFYSELNNKLAKYYTAKLPTNTVVGYLGVWHIVDEAHITTIAVDRNFLRKSIAESLVVKMIKDCYNVFIKYITLEVRVSNIPAIKLYEKYGFRSLGTRKGYYQDNNEDALIMWTENIFDDKFKNMFETNLKKLREKVLIK